MDSDISFHLTWFQSYAAAMRAREQEDPQPLDIKLRHSLAVLDKARCIVTAEGFVQPLSRICLLAALYHDVARFEQFLRYRTFRDALSCNHGHMGVVILKREARLVAEEDLVRKNVLAVVGIHNRFSLPMLPPLLQAAAQVVRDADKLDIMRVMDEHLSGPRPYSPTVVLSQPDNPNIAGAEVLQAALEGRVAAYAHLRSVNDFRLLLGTWLFEMHFAESRRLFVQDGHAYRLLQALPDDGPHARARDALLARLDAVAEHF
ncbi:MAG: HD domain-containing protein [Desulfovibrio sp.]|nr:HD domain-containing protein [Desulfovibrio sp.]